MNVISIDLGGTKISAAVFDECGNCFHREKELIPDNCGEGDISRMILQLIGKLKKESGIEKREIKSIGICVPGIVDTFNKTVWAPNLPGWKAYPLEQEVRNFLGDDSISVSIENDRVCYLNGEVWKGCAKDCTDVIFLAIGTGIGTGIMSGGGFIRGKNDISGAVGWMALDTEFKDEFRRCGNFEYYASGNGLINLARKITEELHLQDDLFLSNTFRSEDIFLYFREGNKVAELIIEEAIKYWGAAVANLISIFNPEKIVFGGGVFGPGLQLLDKIKIEAKKWAQPVSMKYVEFSASLLGGDAGLYGAGKFAVDIFGKM